MYVSLYSIRGTRVACVPAALVMMATLPVYSVTAATATEVAGPRVELNALEVRADSRPVKGTTAGRTGLVLFAEDNGPQVAVMAHAPALAACVREGETTEVGLPLGKLPAGPFSVSARVDLVAGGEAEVEIFLDGRSAKRTLRAGEGYELSVRTATDTGACPRIISRGTNGEALVRWRGIRVVRDGESVPVVVVPGPLGRATCPPPEHAVLRPLMEDTLVEWDWGMQDGIGTPRASVSYNEAVRQTLARGDELIRDLRDAGVDLAGEAGAWEKLRAERAELGTNGKTPESAWEDLWRRTHRLRRRIVMMNPLVNTGPLVFATHVPGGVFSHQLTQYQGDNARPGGGLWVLQEPGRSMKRKALVQSQLPQGAYMHPRVSYDGRYVFFSYCEVDSDPGARGKFTNRHFHLYRVDAEGSNLKQLTDGPYDDHSPCCLPNGEIVFSSTRRGGYHRCGKGPCPVYTLALCGPDGSNPRTISYHETHEWDPSVLNDGRVVYTRWDYVDRNAVHYQQLWSVRPDGTNVRIYYGNNTLSPTGTWEARAIPGSQRVMATAAAHHAMTAGSIIVVDTTKGVDGPEPLTRLTPDVPFPESEAPVGRWHAPAGVEKPRPEPVEQKRWPGHCYRSPFPLSEKYFLAAYSFEQLIGEPEANPPNMFGLYIVDAFGNKELIYRDLNISSIWPMPLRPRARPPVLPSVLVPTDKEEGTFFLQNVNDSWAPLPEAKITALRIVQVLPKTTPDADRPPVGVAHAAPGKQVLGTVPVEADGSAYFRAPARKPILFQALDERGRAVQLMYSLTYLQPGEDAGCIGCHEDHSRSSAGAPKTAEALKRPPSAIRPGPEGSNPLSYPLLVQPVLDSHCVSCHSAEQPRKKSGGIVLTGDLETDKSGKPIDRGYSRSYRALIGYVSFSEWGKRPSAKTYPGQYGARASKLMKLLLEGHYQVKLSKEDLDRLVTWMDTNALFYGTFNVEDQERQLRGERIEGPDLE